MLPTPYEPSPFWSFGTSTKGTTPLATNLIVLNPSHILSGEKGMPTLQDVMEWSKPWAKLFVLLGNDLTEGIRVGLPVLISFPNTGM